MKKNEMTWQAMLAEAVGLVAAVVYLGLQIYYGVAYHVSAVQILLNIACSPVSHYTLYFLAYYIFSDSESQISALQTYIFRDRVCFPENKRLVLS